MAYTLTQSGYVTRDADGVTIPNEPLNKDYAEFLAWEAAGGTPAPYVPPTVVHSCKLWQLEAVLGPAQWAAAQAAVAALNNPGVTAFFNHGTNDIPANSTTLLALGAAIGMTSAQVVAAITAAAPLAIP